MLKFQKELMWESLCLMYQAQQREGEGRRLNGLELRLVDALAQDQQTGKLSATLTLLQEQLRGAEIFLLWCDLQKSSAVIETSFTDEFGLRWPLFGPMLRALDNQPSVIFDAWLIPILKALPLVRSGQARAIVMRAWATAEQRFILIATHQSPGAFSDRDQHTLDRGAWLLKARGAALLEGLVQGYLDEVRGAGEEEQELELNSSILLPPLRSPRPLEAQSAHDAVAHRGSSREPSSSSSGRGDWGAKSGRGAPAVGALIGQRYHLLEQLGAGGFGTVYKGYDPLIQRPVALKLLNQRLLEGEDGALRVEEFTREAALAASIRHPNIVTVYDLGFHGTPPRPFIVMEFLAGLSLAEELQRAGPIETGRLLRLMIPALDGLGEAHRNGLVHRDLKPSNFLLTPTVRGEELRLVDFGIAFASSNQPDKEGEVVGTLSYLAPEYLKNREISPRLDVYQMGLVMLELLTGRRPVRARGAETIFQIISGHLELPENFSTHPLAELIARAVSLDPNRRYADGAEMCAALRLVAGRLDRRAAGAER